MVEIKQGGSVAGIIAEIRQSMGAKPELADAINTIESHYCSAKDLVINPKFQDLLNPLRPEEFAALTESIKQNGCREPVTAWGNVIVDGHNRIKITRSLGLDCKVVQVDFADEEAAMDWIDANQIARRNLTPEQLTMALGRRYLRTKQDHGGQLPKGIGNNCPSLSTAAKLALEHGVSERTVKNAGAFAAAVETLDADTRNVVLGVASQKDILAIAKMDEPTRQQVVAKLAEGSKTFANAVQEIKRAELVKHLNAVETIEAKKVTGVYDVVVIDPPWAMEKIERDVAPTQVAFDYPTMSLDEIAANTPPCADDCHLFLWTTQKWLPDALDLLKKWGLKYVLTFVWHKNGGFQPFGLPQFNCEFALYARKGTPKFVDTKAFNTCFSADRTGHSEKPEEFYALLRRVTAGRRLDMYNRRAIEGFDSWGKESANANV